MVKGRMDFAAADRFNEAKDGLFFDARTWADVDAGRPRSWFTVDAPDWVGRTSPELGHALSLARLARDFQPEAILGHVAADKCYWPGLRETRRLLCSLRQRLKALETEMDQWAAASDRGLQSVVAPRVLPLSCMAEAKTAVTKMRGCLGEFEKELDAEEATLRRLYGPAPGPGMRPDKPTRVVVIRLLRKVRARTGKALSYQRIGDLLLAIGMVSPVEIAEAEKDGATASEVAKRIVRDALRARKAKPGGQVRVKRS